MKDVLLWIKERWGETAGFRAAGHGTIHYLSCLYPRMSGIFPAIIPFRQHPCWSWEASLFYLPDVWQSPCAVSSDQCKIMLKTACEAAQNYLNELDFFSLFYFDSNVQTFYQLIKKMEVNRLSQNLNLTECFEINWFKQLVFFFFLYLVYKHV